MKQHNSNARRKTSAYTLLLSLLLIVAVLFPLVGEVSTVDDDTGDTASMGIAERQKACGDIRAVNVNWENSVIVATLSFVDPPFSSGATEFIQSWVITYFVAVAPVQADLGFHVNAKGNVSVNAKPDAQLAGAEFAGTNLTVRFNAPKGCRKFGFSVESRLQWLDGWCTDSLEFASVKYVQSSDVKTPAPTAAKAERVLNRVKYNPPTGGYGWKDDPEKSAELLTKAKELVATDPRAARQTAEEAYSLTPDYSIKDDIVTLMIRIPMRDYEPLSDAEKARADILVGYEHLRVINEINVESWPGRILRVQLIDEICTRYGLPKQPGLEEGFRERYLDTIKHGSFPEVEAARMKDGERQFLRLAAEAYRKKNFELAYRFYHEYLLYLSAGLAEGDREKAEEGLLKSSQAAITNVPRDERKRLDDVMKHRAFEKIAMRTSDHFIIVGPGDSIYRIPDTSIRNFDIAHMVESDMFNTSPNGRDRRITVFLRELYGISGGMAGGDTIFISFKYAKGRATALNIDNKLYFHELAHCLIEYDFPAGGLNEGIADYGASIAKEMLNKENDDFREYAIKAFNKYFVARGIPFHRIPPYAPSDGFLTLPLSKVATVGGKYDWGRMRKALRDLRNFPFRTQSLHQWSRCYVKILEPYFGLDVYKWFQEAGFDVTPDSAYMLQDELDYYRDEYQYAKMQGHLALRAFASRIAQENPTSYIRQTAMLAALQSASKVGDKSERANLLLEAGIPVKLLCAGPFSVSRDGVYSDYISPDAKLLQIEKWETTGRPPEEIITNKDELRVLDCNDEGWFSFSGDSKRRSGVISLIGYTTNLVGPWEGNAWITTDSSYSFWVDDLLVYSDYSASGDSLNDGYRLPLKLSAGYHRIAVRLQGSGQYKTRLRFTNLDGSSADLFPFSTGYPPTFSIRRPPNVNTAETIFEDEFTSGSSIRNWSPTLMTLNMKNGMLHPVQAVCPIQLFNVPRVEDPRSMLGMMWLKKSKVPDMALIRVHFGRWTEGNDVRGAIVLDGEGGEEINSGHVLHFKREGNTIGLSLLRYNRPLVTVGAKVDYPQLVFDIYRFESWVWADLNEVRILDPFRLDTINPGLFGVALTPSMGLDHVKIMRLQKP